MTTKVNSYGWKALLGSAVGYAMDGFDLLILGFILSAISADLGLTPAQSGSLVTCTLIVAVFGGIVFGALSDKYGRVRVLTWTIILFAVFTGLCALAQGYWDLLVYRTIAGIGLGGEFGIAGTSSCKSRFLRGAWLASGCISGGIVNPIIIATNWLAWHVFGGDFPGICGVVFTCPFA